MNKTQLDNYYNNIFDTSPAGFNVEILKIVMPLILIQKDLLHKTSFILETKYDLTHSQLNTLAILLFNKRVMSPTELSQSLLFSSGGMSKLLKNLETKKLIKRVASTQDKRSILVQLSSEGKAVLEQAIPDLLKEDNQMFSILDDNERQCLSDIFQKIIYEIHK